MFLSNVNDAHSFFLLIFFFLSSCCLTSYVRQLTRVFGGPEIAERWPTHADQVVHLEIRWKESERQIKVKKKMYQVCLTPSIATRSSYQANYVRRIFEWEWWCYLALDVGGVCPHRFFFLVPTC
jgi:hypothetical protein